MEPSQIRSLISRIARLEKTQHIQPEPVGMYEYDGIDEHIDEIELDSDEEDFYGFDGIDAMSQNNEVACSDEEDFFGFE